MKDGFVHSFGLHICIRLTVSVVNSAHHCTTFPYTVNNMIILELH